VSGGTKPSYTRQQFIMLRRMLDHDAVGIARIAEEIGLTRQTVYPNATHQTRRSPKVPYGLMVFCPTKSAAFLWAFVNAGCGTGVRAQLGCGTDTCSSERRPTPAGWVTSTVRS
jgi:hypothetical protein